MFPTFMFVVVKPCEVKNLTAGGVPLAKGRLTSDKGFKCALSRKTSLFCWPLLTLDMSPRSIVGRASSPYAVEVVHGEEGTAFIRGFGSCDGSFNVLESLSFQLESHARAHCDITKQYLRKGPSSYTATATMVVHGVRPSA
jgi:hypothetical protein